MPIKPLRAGCNIVNSALPAGSKDARGARTHCGKNISIPWHTMRVDKAQSHSAIHRDSHMTITVGIDSSNTRKTLAVGDASIAYYSIPAATEAGLGDFSKLPAALKVVLENMLRFEDGGRTVSVDDIKAFAEWGAKGGKNPREIAYRPARVLMQDFTGVPAVVDLAAMRDGIVALGGDPEKINPLNPVDLVIDHSVMIDEFGNPRAFQMNVDREYERNMERYTFLKWGQNAFNNFRVVPPEPAFATR